MSATVSRFVIRRSDTKQYYNGVNTYGIPWDDLQRAKVFKNASGAKVACGDLRIHLPNPKPTLEIVQAELVVNETTIIKI